MSFFGTPSGTHMIIGGTGSGKSMFLSQAVGYSVTKTKRIVVGNLPIKFGSAETVLERKFGWIGDLEKRVFFMDDILCLRKFWLHRGFGWVVPDIEKKEWDLGLTTDFTYAYRYQKKEATEETPPRVCLCRLHRSEIFRLYQEGELDRELVSVLPAVQYVIDECGNVFPQLSKQLIGQAIVFYLSQKRKVGSEGDDIICSAQCASMVDKTFRDLANDWLFLTNWGQRRKGIFRGPKRSSWGLYSPMPRSEHEKPMAQGQFAIEGDEGWGGFYDTSAGVGIQGGLQADKGGRPPGIHWAWAIVFIIAILIAVAQLPKVFRKGVGVVMGQVGTQRLSSEFAPKSVMAVAQAKAPDESKPVGMSKESHTEKESVTYTGRYITGVHPFGGVLRIYWSDGDETTSADREFEGVERMGRMIVAIKWAGKKERIGGTRNVLSRPDTNGG